MSQENSKNTQVKPEAYYRKVVKNSIIDEYRGNARQARYSFPVPEFYDSKYTATREEDAIDNIITNQSAPDWLLMIDNPLLHEGLTQLKEKDLEFVFILFSRDYTQRQMAEYLGISQSAVSARWIRIRKKLEKYFK